MTTNDDGLTTLQEAVKQNNEYVVYALLKNSSEELQERQLNEQIQMDKVDRYC